MVVGQLNRAVAHRSKDLPLNGFGPWYRTLAFCAEGLEQTAGLRSGHRRNLEKLWQEFFADPSWWWDNRAEKVNARYPDFKHKKTQKALWLNSSLKPPWVEAKLAAMAPGTMQVDIFTWNKRLERYAKAGQIWKMMSLFQQMQQAGMTPDKFTFVPVLNACSNLRAVAEGRYIHSQIIQTGHELDVYVGSSLIDMYANCANIGDAEKVFNKMPLRNVVLWNAMILGCVKCGQGQKALDLSRQMQEEGVNPDAVTFVGVLSACASLAALDEGQRVHEQIIKTGLLESDIILGNSLIDMYVKCGKVEDAWTAFNKMPTRDVVSWNTMILGHVKFGHGQKALDLSQQMRGEGVDPNPGTFVALLNACASVASFREGRRIHQEITRAGCESNVFVGSSLIDMYAKCGSIEDAEIVFNKMPIRDVVAWNAMILGLVKYGQGHKALKLSRQMQGDVAADPVTYVGVLNACASLTALEEGRRVHGQIIKRGWESDIFVGSSLIDMYAKCGNIDDAYATFNKMTSRNVVSWNAIILGHVKCGKGQTALDLSRQMRGEGVDPNPGTFVGLLNACASVAALEEGRLVHDQIRMRGCESDLFVGNSLIYMYGKCGSVEDARKVFEKMPTRDVVSWNAMLGGYALHGHAEGALKHFKQMSQEDEEINGVTFLSLLSACSHGGLVDEGLNYFESMCSVYGLSRTVDHYSCVVDLLGRCGQLHLAEDLIRNMSCEPNSSVWMSLLGACRVHRNSEMAECIADRVLQADPKSAAGYILLSNIYADAGKWDSSAKMQLERLRKHSKETPDCTRDRGEW